MQVRPLRAWVLALLLLTACGTPPHKEMNDAQAAIDAARAAGADRYAPDEFTAALNSQSLATQAVDQRDYRLALNHALESRENAQNATRVAGEAQDRLRGEIDRVTTEVKGLLAQANGRLAAAEKARVSRRITTSARRSVAAVNDDLQKASAAAQKQDFAAAQTALAGAKQRITQTITQLDTATRARRR